MEYMARCPQPHTAMQNNCLFGRGEKPEHDTETGMMTLEPQPRKKMQVTCSRLSPKHSCIGIWHVHKGYNKPIPRNVMQSVLVVGPAKPLIRAFFLRTTHVWQQSQNSSWTLGNRSNNAQKPKRQLGRGNQPKTIPQKKIVAKTNWTQ